MSRRARKQRVQLDLAPEQVVSLDALRERFALRSRADAVRAALAIVEWVDAETTQGRRVVAVGPESVSWFAMPGLQRTLGAHTSSSDTSKE